MGSAKQRQKQNNLPNAPYKKQDARKAKPDIPVRSPYLLQKRDTAGVG
jgi:hypothetical protein